MAKALAKKNLCKVLCVSNYQVLIKKIYKWVLWTEFAMKLIYLNVDEMIWPKVSYDHMILSIVCVPKRMKFKLDQQYISYMKFIKYNLPYHRMHKKKDFPYDD